jgi:hypothetical protein
MQPAVVAENAGAGVADYFENFYNRENGCFTVVLATSTYVFATNTSISELSPKGGGQLTL